MADTSELLDIERQAERLQREADDLFHKRDNLAKYRKDGDSLKISFADKKYRQELEKELSKDLVACRFELMRVTELRLDSEGRGLVQKARLLRRIIEAAIGDIVLPVEAKST